MIAAESKIFKFGICHTVHREILSQKDIVENILKDELNLVDNFKEHISLEFVSNATVFTHMLVCVVISTENQSSDWLKNYKDKQL
jgi:bacterioferritin (cytochrome b1)